MVRKKYSGILAEGEIPCLSLVEGLHTQGMFPHKAATQLRLSFWIGVTCRFDSLQTT